MAKSVDVSVEAVTACLLSVLALTPSFDLAHAFVAFAVKAVVVLFFYATLCWRVRILAHDAYAGADLDGVRGRTGRVR